MPASVFDTDPQPSIFVSSGKVVSLLDRFSREIQPCLSRIRNNIARRPENSFREGALGRFELQQSVDERVAEAQLLVDAIVYAGAWLDESLSVSRGTCSLADLVSDVLPQVGASAAAREITLRLGEFSREDVVACDRQLAGWILTSLWWAVATTATPGDEIELLAGRGESGTAHIGFGCGGDHDQFCATLSAQLNTSSKTSEEDCWQTSLPLAVAAQLAVRMGGSVSMGEGPTFALILPTEADSAMAFHPDRTPSPRCEGDS